MMDNHQAKVSDYFSQYASASPVLDPRMSFENRNHALIDDETRGEEGTRAYQCDPAEIDVQEKQADCGYHHAKQ